MDNKFSELKLQTQEIIDLIAAKDLLNANIKLAEVSEMLDEVMDFTDDDHDIIEIVRYQVLLNQLHQKINVS